MGKIIVGIDEAGRGAVIGPLVVAGVALREENEQELKKIGVRDSKELTAKKREKLAEKIQEIVDNILILKVAACRIDDYRKNGVNLNKLEGMKMMEIIDYLGGDKIYVDAYDVNTDRLKRLLEKSLKKEGAEVVAEHFADKKYPAVSAASIIAKVERDKEIEELKKEYGDIGPGYPSNEITMNWLKEWLKTHKDFPPIVRKSWDTISVLKNDHKQSRLTGWFKGLLKTEEECKVKESSESKKTG